MDPLRVAKGGNVARDGARHSALFSTALLIAAALIAAVSHGNMDTTARISSDDPILPQPADAKFWTLGFDAVAADYYWLQAVQVLGGAKLGIEGKALRLAHLIDLVTALDPWVDHPYRFAAVWLTDDESLVRAANRLLERGVSYHPREWRNRYYLGFNHFFYLEEQLAAAEVLESALGLPKVPRYLGALVARLRGGTAGLETAAALLARLARDTEDQYTRAEYLKALDELETERRARTLDRAREEFWSRRGRDIDDVAELLGGPDPVLTALPAAHPNVTGFTWVLDQESGQIVSSFYRSRYELHVHPLDRARQERWRKSRGEVEET